MEAIVSPNTNISRHGCAHSALLVLLLGIAGCATLEPPELTPEYTPAPAQAEIWQALDANHSDNWFVLLNDGPAALDWRLRAIDTATESIDLQTFLWTFDTVGAFVLDHLMQAADRGVTVKLLIDDSFLAKEDPMLLALEQHPNIEYRVYNPYKRRSGGIGTRMALNLGDFERLDHRMHNKAMIIDNRIAIVGGRNLADEYFGIDATANFRDLELITGGPIVKKIAAAFDNYWNDRWSVPIHSLAHVDISTADLDAARRVTGENTHLHVEEGHRALLQRWRDVIAAAHTGTATLLVDEPPRENPADPGEAPTQVADQLIELIGSAQQELTIISAYLIPTERVEKLVDDVIGRGVRVRILTNSIASNNHITAHSAYRKHVDTLLENGAELHEVRTDANSRAEYMLSPVEAKALALHAKALLVDDDRVFIGSTNLDPRSLRINTEMGLLVESPALNAETLAAVMPDFSMANAWQLEREPDGQIVWVSDDRTLRVQPALSFMQRIEEWFFRHLPIENEM